MWPSFETAVWWYDKANIFLVGALAVGVIATGLVVWMGNVKEEYLRRDLADTNEQAANAELRAAEANLALEKFKAPRILTPEEQQLLISKVSKFEAQEYEVITYLDMKEARDFSEQLSLTLSTAGWKFVQLKSNSWPLPGTSGVHVFVHGNADPKIKDAANALVSALEAIGKAPALKQMDPKSPKDNKIALSIGTKP